MLIALLTLPVRLLGRGLRRLLRTEAVRRLLRGLTLLLLVLALEAAGLTLLFGTAHRDRLLWLVLAAAIATGCLALLVLFALHRRGRLRVRRFESLLALTPAQFELAVGELLRTRGYRGVKRVGGSGDLGADLLCRDRRGRTVVVQCKRYAPGIRAGSRELQTFIGMMTVHHKADRGIFVTTSSFTAPAIALARDHQLELIDGAALARLLSA